MIQKGKRLGFSLRKIEVMLLSQQQVPGDTIAHPELPLDARQLKAKIAEPDEKRLRIAEALEQLQQTLEIIEASSHVPAYRSKLSSTTKMMPAVGEVRQIARLRTPYRDAATRIDRNDAKLELLLRQIGLVEPRADLGHDVFESAPVDVEPRIS